MGKIGIINPICDIQLQLLSEELIEREKEERYERRIRRRWRWCDKTVSQRSATCGDDDEVRERRRKKRDGGMEKAALLLLAFLLQFFITTETKPSGSSETNFSCCPFLLPHSCLVCRSQYLVKEGDIYIHLHQIAPLYLLLLQIVNDRPPSPTIASSSTSTIIHLATPPYQPLLS